jgi:hypothetical protein
MINLTPQQIDDRYESLPDSLKDALFSVYNAEEIERVGRSQFLSDEKISLLARLTGRVIMGFINADDFARDIQKDLGVPAETAGLIAREIDRKIFYAIKEDIRKVYAPVTSEELPETSPKIQEESIAPEAAPKMKTSEVEPPLKEPPKAGEPLPLETLIAKSTPTTATPAAPSTLEPQSAKIHPFALGGKPASKTSASGVEELVDLPTLKKITRVAEEPQSSELKPEAGMQPEATSAAPAPFMLHKEETLKPILESKPLEVKETAGKTEEKKPVAARVEMLNLKKEDKQAPPTTKEAPTERVVHYSQFRTPINPFGKTISSQTATIKPQTAAEIEDKKIENAPHRQEVSLTQAPEEVVDLSTFKRASNTAVDSKTDKVEVNGNTVDLRGSTD